MYEIASFLVLRYLGAEQVRKVEWCVTLSGDMYHDIPASGRSVPNCIAHPEFLEIIYQRFGFMQNVLRAQRIVLDGGYPYCLV